MSKITKDTTLDEVIKDDKAQKILLKYNVPCLGCAFAQYEMKELKLGDICKMYNIDIKGLLKDLNTESVSAEQKLKTKKQPSKAKK